MSFNTTIGVTGYRSSFGKELIEYLSKNYNILEVDNLDNISKCSVFINSKYSNSLQENILTEIFDLWENKEALIINIVSSSVLDEIPFHESFVRFKTKLSDKAHQLCNNNPNKKVRVTNLYPFTLSTNNAFDMLNKVNVVKIAEIVDWLIKQPSSLELRDISIYPATINKQIKKDKLL